MNIPNSVTSIGSYAFEGCRGLTSVTIPSSVTEIGERAFEGCSGLTSLTIPNNVISIWDNAFSYCTKLGSIIIEDGESELRLGNSEYYAEIETRGMFVDCPITTLYLGRNISYPLYFSRVEYSPFKDFTTLREVTIANSVTYLDSYIFSGCSGLTSIDIPNSVTYIGSYAFSGCNGLTSIDIPNSVTNIGTQAFRGCSGLISLTIGNGIWSYSSAIGEDAFLGCWNLTSLNINCNFIGNWFSSCKLLTELNLGSEVKRIGASAFSNCGLLSSISIPSNVTTIEENAFNGCSNVTHIVLGSGLEVIGNNAFANCRKLEDVYSYAVRYPTASYDTFTDSYIDYATLHVPAQSVTQYKNQLPWSGFMDVVPLTGSDPQPTGIESVYATGVSSESQNSKYFTLGGKQLSQPQRGVNIVKMSDGTTKKIMIDRKAN